MSKKGGSIHKKRLNASTITVLEKRKGHKWIVGTKPGPHNKELSVPITVVLRDLFKTVKTAKEAKKLIRDGKILIDNKKIKDHKLPIGLMDLISFPEEKITYMMTLNKHGKLIGKEIKENNTKLGKVVKKTKIKKDKITITLHDGKTIISDNNVKIGDTILLSLKDKKINNLLKLEIGANCYIMDGKHVGHIGILKEIIKTENSKQKIAKIDAKGKEIITVLEYLFIVNPEWGNE
ncbi:30S ribosomal protein S4e [Candidatus Micrarchaeota archaeon]|nr:30S ribosomal protein S4e [Candidatus Micrarchaeota archaeon]